MQYVIEAGAHGLPKELTKIIECNHMPTRTAEIPGVVPLD
jgi:hypothetical protein